MDLMATDVDRETAKAKYREYREAVLKNRNEEDVAIMRGYREVVRGNQVIALPATLQAGGRDELGRPRLAVARADAKKCWLERCTYDGSVRFVSRELATWQTPGRSSNNKKDVREFPAGTLEPIDIPNPAPAYTQARSPVPGLRERIGGRELSVYAIVPNVPPALRPAHSLANYDILWEVDEWHTSPKPPRDPALLKHIGGDLYAVMAVWDLTDLERLVIAGRKDAE